MALTRLHSWVFKCPNKAGFDMEQSVTRIRSTFLSLRQQAVPTRKKQNKKRTFNNGSKASLTCFQRSSHYEMIRLCIYNTLNSHEWCMLKLKTCTRVKWNGWCHFLSVTDNEEGSLSHAHVPMPVTLIGVEKCPPTLTEKELLTSHCQ